MKLFLDTSSEDFLLLLIDENNKIIDNIFYSSYKKKVNLIVDSFKEILKKNNFKVSDLSSLYTNIGPGFFTGTRSSLVFFRTLAMINKLDVYTCTSFDILEKQNQSENLYLDAQGGSAYHFKKSSKNIEVINNFEGILNKINYNDLVINWDYYKNIFIKTDKKNLLDLSVLYIKKPQIGEKK
ncbi:tRNA (adenosine(37)-N6)-threonylcarbamoyltransferase complex dimerization subunit type 1 TsaB [Mycoplasma crocodyli]|uniref:Gcp-like domain-containing protein n=1 Tax=Mycoplasma crocodyli (strain ATCC 51981 / MP145) TaxID=512564 RepID=D5E4M8_MYCCM|nr:tRNA (adenosine(37)-N6)-threonylcarbamoyltransferase complex dimerization subunit type 1 TsaB [Mycoplasma crocodyli]ADE19975.1 hypothetical protein MCRO_0037 [Mycoplasma crocodyli MP145]